MTNSETKMITNSSASKSVPILIAAALVFMATNADAPSFNMTVPTLQEQFQASYFMTQILTNAAQLCVAALVLAAGSLGDLYGRRRWLMIGTIGMFSGFVLQTAATGAGMMVLARLLVGCSTALTTALTLAVINVNFTGGEKSKAIGVFLGLGSVSAALTPILSQWLSQNMGWRFSFILPLILAGTGIFLIWRFVPESRDTNARKIDGPGILLNAIGLAGIVYGCILAGTEGWTSRNTLIWLGIGAIGLGLFIWWEGRAPDPALKLALFKNPVFALSVFAALMLYMVDYGIHPIFSMFLQSVQGYSPLVTSILLLPWALGAAVMAPIAGRWATRFSPRKLIAIGLGAGAATLLLSFFLTPTSSPWLILLILTPWALAYGVANIPRTSILMTTAPPEDSGAASGANSMGGETGSALGLAIFGTLIANFTSNNYLEKLTSAGLSSEQITQAVAVLKSAINETLQQEYPKIAPDIVQKLIAGFEVSYTDAVITTLVISALVIFITAGLVWIGMRGRADEPLTDVAISE